MAEHEEGSRAAEEQRERFREAVERKSRQALERSLETGRKPANGPSDDVSPIEAPLVEDGRGQDVLSPRAKNTGKGKKTADKWNQ
jgi:hypothetical protein